MENATLRNEIHHYIDQADDRFLSLVYGMIQADNKEENEDFTKDEITLIEERLEEYKKYSTSGSTWDEVKAKLLTNNEL